MSRKNRRSRTIGRLLFYIPVVVIFGIVVIGLVSMSSPSSSGTLVVEAITSPRYAPSLPLHLSATVGSRNATTPFNLTLSAGEYTVTYASNPWFVAPSPRSISLEGGQTEYAIGTYAPIPKAVKVGEQGFNSTSVRALHGMTPVVWINSEPATVMLQIDGIGRVKIEPNGNFTHVFQSAGTFDFTLVSSSTTNSSGAVQSL